MRSLLETFVLLGLFTSIAAAAIEKPGEGQLLAPGGRRFPLKHTGVRASVSGPVARVVVRQTFENPFDEAIEAIYVFPLPDRAAVDGMTIEIGPRRIVAEIKRRAEAEKAYEEAKRAGKTAALLTQERPNIFTQHVANILPGETIVVEIRYVEHLDYEKGGYTFVFPMVVGPRFNPAGAVPDADRVPSEPSEFLRPGERSGHDIALTVDLDAGVPFRDLRCDSHGIDVARAGDARARVAIQAGDRIPNKDFVLRWTTAGEEPAVAVLAHRSDAGGFFTLMIQPERDPAEDVVLPREVFLVVDCSGSMRGMPIDTAKAVVHRTLDTLDPRDTFQILRFSEKASGMAAKPLPATPENLRRGHEYIDAMSGGGGTHMIEGIKAALAGDRQLDRLRVIHFLTDGYIGNETQILEAIRNGLDGARIFPLGVGSSPNRYLIDRMARVGRGAAAYVRQGASAERIREEVARFVERVRQATLVDLEIDWSGLPVKELQPTKLLDLFAGQPVLVHGVYDGPGETEIVLTGRRGGRPYRQAVRVSLPDREERNGAQATLWARAKIRELLLASGPAPSEETKEQVTSLALEFRLMSAYTAFIAVEERVVVEEGGARKTVRQPVPLPEGTEWDGFFGEDRLSDTPFAGGASKGKTVGLGGGSGGSFGGAGGGRAGRRTLRASGGGAATMGAVDLGLEWLKGHRDPTGAWGGGDPESTGLALLTYLGAGETYKRGKYRAEVKEGLRFLRQSQGADGALAPDTRGHAIAALAICETWAHTRSPLWKQTSQLAIDLLHSRQGANGGWEDLETTAWAVAALASAKSGRLRVDDEAFRRVIAYLDGLTDETTGRTADTATTARALLTRLLAGQDPKDAVIAKGADMLRMALPDWKRRAIDLEAWTFATSALFWIGGDPWKTWHPALKTALVDTQGKGGDARGSWLPAGAKEKDRLRATCHAQLCLQVYYRYARTFGRRR